MLFALIFLGLAAISSIEVDEDRIDFQTRILPIFQQHCLDCHGGENQEGELSLESVDSIRGGGHTGNSLLAGDLADSELHLRITSTSDGYRMPKIGEPLSADQIELIGQWIVGESQSPSPVAKQPQPSVATTEPSGSFPLPDFLQPLEALEPSQRYSVVASTLLVSVLLIWLLVRMALKILRRTDNRGRQKLKTWLAFGGLTVVFLIATSLLYQRTRTLAAEIATLQNQLASGTPTKPETIVIDADNLPLPPHPMHPQRLGGQYYRGNDERNDSLFNNGFYRTATIDLHLVDAKGNRQSYGDPTPETGAIEIEIQRAPKATKELFGQRVLDSLSLQHFNQSTGSFEELKFEVVEPEELWRAKVILPESSDWTGDRTHGMIYMMYGVQPGGQKVPRPHFGVRYDIRRDGDQISAASDLWMGSMYTLGGRVLVPDDDHVLLDRWFDWRPIPVIEGQGSEDPDLLGLPEHAVQ